MTRRIPARLGLVFGIEFVIDAPDYLRKVPFETRWSWPRSALRLAQPMPPVEQEAWGVPGERLWTAFVFEHDFELVPGDYRVEVLHHGAVLAEAVFQVHRP